MTILWLGLANYQYAPRVGRDSSAAPMDTAQIRQVKQQYYLRADSAFSVDGTEDRSRWQKVSIGLLLSGRC